MDKLVSIILPTFKRPDKLERAINSVIKQTYSYWELIIIDDNPPNSKDRQKTNSFMARYIDDKRFIYIKNEQNLGGALSRNEGIKKANGSYIAFLDDDDEYLPEKIKKQVLLFSNSKFENLGLIYCKSKKIDETGKIIGYSMVKAKGNMIKHHLIRNTASSSAIMIKKSVLDKIGGFKNLIMGQEYDLMLRIFSLGYTADYIDEVLVTYHIHNDERISTSDKMINGLDELYKIKKPFLNLLSNKEKRNLHLLHFLNKFRVYLSQDKKNKAFKYILLSIYSNPLNIRGYLELLNLIIGNKKTLVFKAFLHKQIY
jgi:glycosyltransferase involved in cell wall biosynthesis